MVRPRRSGVYIPFRAAEVVDVSCNEGPDKIHIGKNAKCPTRHASTRTSPRRRTNATGWTPCDLEKANGLIHVSLWMVSIYVPTGGGVHSRAICILGAYFGPARTAPRLMIAALVVWQQYRVLISTVSCKAFNARPGYRVVRCVMCLRGHRDC
jgi:hypothetical protein